MRYRNQSCAYTWRRANSAFCNNQETAHWYSLSLILMVQLYSTIPRKESTLLCFQRCIKTLLFQLSLKYLSFNWWVSRFSFFNCLNILFLSFLASCICLLYCGVKMRHSFLHNLAEGPSPGLELNTARVPVLESSFGSLIFSPWCWALFQPKPPHVFLNWSILWLGGVFQGQTSYQFSSLGRQHSRKVIWITLEKNFRLI